MQDAEQQERGAHEEDRTQKDVGGSAADCPCLTGPSPVTPFAGFGRADGRVPGGDALADAPAEASAVGGSVASNFERSMRPSETANPHVTECGPINPVYGPYTTCAVGHSSVRGLSTFCGPSASANPFQNANVSQNIAFGDRSFSKKSTKYERFMRPSSTAYKTAHVTHPDREGTFLCDILGVKKSESLLYAQLGVITKGTIVEVNAEELNEVTAVGKIVWGKYAEVTNNPAEDGRIEAVFLP